MFDHVPPTVFWPGVVLVWLVVSYIVGCAVGAVIRRFNP